MLITVEYFRPTYRLLQTSLVSAGLPLTTSLPINTCSSYDTPLSLTPPNPSLRYQNSHGISERGMLYVLATRCLKLFRSIYISSTTAGELYMKGLPMSTGRKDPMASRRSEKKNLAFLWTAPHTSQGKNHNPPRAILSSQQLQTMSLSWHLSQTRTWYFGHAFLCVDDVGGLLGFPSQNQTAYFMILHTNPDLQLVGLVCTHCVPSEVFLSRVSESAVGKLIYFFFSIFCMYSLPTLARIATLGNNNEKAQIWKRLCAERSYMYVHTDVPLGSYVY